jgi:hypothetical protein
MEQSDKANWGIQVEVAKWADSDAFDAGVAPDTVEVFERNLLLNAGIARLLSLLTGAGGTAFNAANSRIGVGNGTAAAAATQTDLQGASKFFKVMDATFPSTAGQTTTWRSTFASAEANFAWEEWGIDNGTTDGATVTAPLLNRRAVAMGTKASGSTWQLTVTLTIS